MRLRGKRAVVTGGASGVGLATVRRFVAEGARVAVVDRDAAGARAAVGDAGLALAADVAVEEQVEHALAAVVERFGGLDVVVSNAAVQLFAEDARVHELDAGVFDRTVAVNLRGAFLVAKHGVEALCASGGGSLVFTASPTGLFGVAPGFTAYSASKAGLHGLMRVIAADYAADGIRANAVVPGFTDTPLVAAISGDERERLERAVPLGRAGTAEEVAGMMAFLASDDASYATGGVFTVDGGLTAV